MSTTMKTTIEHLDTPRPVSVGGLMKNGRRAVYDDATGIEIGSITSDAGPATIGDAVLSHVDRDADGVACGGTVRGENGRGYALDGAFALYKLFPRLRAE